MTGATGVSTTSVAGNDNGGPLRVGFVLEHSLGHVTFTRLAQRAVALDPSIAARWHLLEALPPTDLQRRLLSQRNYALQVGLRARLALRGAARDLDALLIHTQTPALLSGGVIGRVPTVISTDATPRNIDTLGAAYGHRRGSILEEGPKRALWGSVLRRAAKVVPSTHWAADSLVRDYGVDPGRIQIIRSGLDLDRWTVADRPPNPVPRILFVGADFSRKGGQDLLAALRSVQVPWELDIATLTGQPVSSGGPVRVHRDLKPADPELVDLYRRADIFAFPTRGDAVPWAVLEAMASGLPVLTTAVGAIPELVGDNDLGLIHPGDVTGLAVALTRLLTDGDLRHQMGKRARTRVELDHDATRTGRQLLAAIRSVAR